MACRVISNSAPSAATTLDIVRTVRFSSADRIWLTRPGETPIALARPAREILCSLMKQVTSSTKVRTRSPEDVSRRAMADLPRLARLPAAHVSPT
jgi:hypothetical protein